MLNKLFDKIVDICKPDIDGPECLWGGENKPKTETKSEQTAETKSGPAAIS